MQNLANITSVVLKNHRSNELYINAIERDYGVNSNVDISGSGSNLEKSDHKIKDIFWFCYIFLVLDKKCKN